MELEQQLFLITSSNSFIGHYQLNSYLNSYMWRIIFRQFFSMCRSNIDSYIDDNKALMRRMYGDPVQEEPAPEPLPHIPGTPASTTLFVQRMVRNFGGARFKRSVQEGKPACFWRLFADTVFLRSINCISFWIYL